MRYVIYILGLIRCFSEVRGFMNNEILNKERAKMKDWLCKEIVAVDLC